MMILGVDKIAYDALKAMSEGKKLDEWKESLSGTDYSDSYLDEAWLAAYHLHYIDKDAMREFNHKLNQNEKEKKRLALFVTILLRIGYVLFILGMSSLIDDLDIRRNLVFVGLLLWIEFGDLRSYMKSKM